MTMVIVVSCHCQCQVQLVDVLAKHLKVKYKILSPSDGSNWWGNLYPNGSSTGSFRDIVEEKVDLGGAYFMRAPYKQKPLEFLFPTLDEKLCFLVLYYQVISYWICSFSLI